ncbi:MAG: tripartite tricarboxylate transporter substrate binding protein, partial [Burkholderiaceae bacterium]|nr:tripartite tricarboxylate transporter substrate binding protein [Burkholderiaceae bacterium]
MKALLCLATCALSILTATSACAQAWPQRPIRVLLPNAAGSTTDVLARIIGRELAPRLGQPVLIEPRPGANGVVAVDEASKAAPDGYTLVIGSNGTYGILPGAGVKLPYDAVTGFEPVTKVNQVSYIFTARNNFPAKNFTEFVAAARQKPGNVSMGFTGSVAELAATLLGTTTGIQFNMVPYKSPAQTIVDLIGDRLDTVMETHATLLKQIQAGTMRPLAVTSRERSALLPDVPTVAESGYPEYEAVAWQGFFAPAGTPKAVIARLSTEINAVLNMPEVRAALRQNGIEVSPSTPEQLGELVKAEIAKWVR